MIFRRRIGHHPPVPLITINLPDEICRRLLSLSPPLDVSKVCQSALAEALDKRQKLEHTENMTTENQIQPQTQPQPRVGRPRKGDTGEKRVYRNVGLPGSVWAWLDEVVSAGAAPSVNDAIERLARFGREHGFAGRLP